MSLRVGNATTSNQSSRPNVRVCASCCIHSRYALLGAIILLYHLLTSSQSASSYECDGCAHHASFHSMENRSEDEVRKRWEQEAKDKADKEDEGQQRTKKRARAIEYSGVAAGLMELLTPESASGKTVSRGRTVVAKKPGRAAAAKARSKVTEIVDEADVIEVD
jgi:hypothetical protein